MDLNFTPEEEAFRSEVRAFLADKLPARLSTKVATGKHLSKADMQEWHAILNARGLDVDHHLGRSRLGRRGVLHDQGVDGTESLAQERSH